MAEIDQISVACFHLFTMEQRMVSVQQQITMEYIGALQMYRLMETLLKENGEIVELIAWEILVNTTIYIETYAISSYIYIL